MVTLTTAVAAPLAALLAAGALACHARVSLLSTVVYIGDRFVEPHEAMVSILDRGYLLGDGVFATMRAYDGICFRASEHLAEISRGAKMFGIDVPATSFDHIADSVDEAARRTSAANAYVRVTLTRGAGGPDDGPVLSIIARPWVDLPSDNDYAHGIAAVTVSPRRIPPECIDGTIKTTSYAVQVLARREVESQSAGEGIQLAVDGSLACGTMSTLFVIINGDLYTPSKQSGCRLGVTRSAVLSIAPAIGLTIHEERMEPSLLERADEVFFASTRVECLPMASLDGQAIGKGSFTRTHALRSAFTALVHEETRRR